MPEPNPPPERDDPRLRQVLDAAADLPAGQRPTYLDGACGGDAALRSQVEALLESLEQADGFLASPTGGGGAETASAPSPPEPAGARVGPYTLLEKVGEGGMGVVYVAEQEHPVRRRVAVKVIKPGMDSGQVIARFEAERQALAMMDHPHIARVLDAGTTEAGRPYFVMELVHGVCITDYCDQNHLTPRQRLELFVPVCRAVQHAHQKGVIHRDLKPTNVLVTLQDGTPVPKVIDFGVAKATQGRLADVTLFTEFRQLVGTPEYMSPEQAESGGLDIDTRADVYALGVLLYELLTGTTPFDAKSLRRAAYAEVQRIIREVEPPRPSTRLSMLGETLTGVAERRRTDPKKLGALMRGDLDWIVMKCLEKDRARRYETANALATDVQRHLNDEPVEASPPSATYKARKFARKYRRQAAALVAVSAALILGIIGTSAGMIRSRILLGRAQEAEKLARENQSTAEHLAGRANAVRDLMLSFLGSVRPNKFGRFDVPVSEFLQNVASWIDLNLQGQPEAEAEVRGTLGWTFLQLGMGMEARTQLARAYEAMCRSRGEESRQALGIASHLISSVGGQPPVAEAMARKYYEVARRSFGEDDTLTKDFKAHIAAAVTLSGKFAEGEALYRGLIGPGGRNARTIAEDPMLHAAYAFALFKGGKLEEAESIYRRIIEVMEDEPRKLEMVDGSRCRRNYGQVLVARGKRDEAKRVFESAIALLEAHLGPAHRETQANLSAYVELLEAMGRYGEALEVYREMLKVDRELGGEEELSCLWRQAAIANLLLVLGRPGEARDATDQLMAQARARKLPQFEQPWLDVSLLIFGGVGSPAQWKSRALRANVSCALEDYLVEIARDGDLRADAINWENLRFRLQRWSIPAGDAPPTFSAVAEGTLQDLKVLAEPGPGIYRLSLDGVLLQAKDARTCDAWLLFADWDVSLYASEVFEESPAAYHAMLGREPAENRRVNNLAFPDNEPNSLPGPGGQTEYFALAASTSLDLPAGRFRLSATSDDGVRVYVDGQLVIDAWLIRLSNRDEAVLDLGPGPHRLRIEYFQRYNPAQLWVQLAPAAGAEVTTVPVAGGNGRKKHLPRADWARVEAGLDAEVRRKPFSYLPLIARAEFLGAKGRFAESARDFAGAVYLNPLDDYTWGMSALVALHAGDVDGYRRRCAEMLRRFGASRYRHTCANVVEACTLMSDAVPDLKPVLEMADRIPLDAKQDPDDLAWGALAKGMASYRAGRLEAAAKYLGIAIRAGMPGCNPPACFFLAMAEFKRGRTSDAEAAFVKGEEVFERENPRDITIPALFRQWMIALHAREEAARLLGHPTVVPATAPTSATAPAPGAGIERP